MTKIRYLAFAFLLATAVTVSSIAYTHDRDDNDGRDGWSHHGKHHEACLPEAKRELLHETMKKTFEKDKASFEQMHKLHEKLHEIIKATTFDRQAFINTTMQIEKLRDSIHKDRVNAFASIAAQFTPEEREMLMRHHGEHHHHHGHHGGWRHDDERRGHDGEGHDHSVSDGQAPLQQDNQDYPSNSAR